MLSANPEKTGDLDGVVQEMEQVLTDYRALATHNSFQRRFSL